MVRRSASFFAKAYPAFTVIGRGHNQFAIESKSVNAAQAVLLFLPIWSCENRRIVEWWRFRLNRQRLSRTWRHSAPDRQHTLHTSHAAHTRTGLLGDAGLQATAASTSLVFRSSGMPFGWYLRANIVSPMKKTRRSSSGWARSCSHTAVLCSTQIVICCSSPDNNNNNNNNLGGNLEQCRRSYATAFRDDHRAKTGYLPCSLSCSLSKHTHGTSCTVRRRLWYIFFGFFRHCSTI